MDPNSTTAQSLASSGVSATLYQASGVTGIVTDAPSWSQTFRGFVFQAFRR